MPEWTTQYPTNIDTTDISMKTVANESAEHLRPIEELRDAVISLETLVGSDSLEEGSLRALAHEIPDIPPAAECSLDPVWNYLTTTQPTGMLTTPEALYQFDDTANRLLDRTVNGHDLTFNAGADSLTYRGSLAGFACSGGQEMRAALPASLSSVAGLTLEFVISINDYTGGDDVLVRYDEGGGNANYQVIYAANTGQLKYFAEHGGGTNISFSFNLILYAGSPLYVALTRNVAGTIVKGYLNGKLLSTSGVLAAPTGGAAGVFKLPLEANPPQATYFSTKATKAQFTDAQILESYQRVRGVIE